jgi:uronate dehydrogenase
VQLDPHDAHATRYQRILLTGAAGRLGSLLRPFLAARWKLRSGDLRAVSSLHANEEAVQFDLGDRRAVDAAVRGCDCIVHFGGIPLEADFEAIRDVNITGTYNVFEAGRLAGVKRIIFASTHHVVGYNKLGEAMDTEAPVLPDSLYGVSKVFGEALGRYYWERFGIEHASLRIGIGVPEPYDRRSLGLWLSAGDLCRLVASCLETPNLGFAVLFGQSANQRAWLSNAPAAHVGYRPQDDAEHFAARILSAAPPVNTDDPSQAFTGGYFTSSTPPRWEGPDMQFVPHQFAAATASKDGNVQA